MTKYKLLKDLPTFKAGSEFWQGDDGNLMTKDSFHNSDIVAYHYMTLLKFPEILESGEWFEEIKAEPWEPEHGEEYFYVSSESQYLDGTTHFVAIFHDDDGQDRTRRSIGNCFETKEDVDKAVEKLKALKRLRDKGFGFESWVFSVDTDDESKVLIKIQAVLDYDAVFDPTTQEDLDLLFLRRKNEKL